MKESKGRRRKRRRRNEKVGAGIRGEVASCFSASSPKRRVCVHVGTRVCLWVCLCMWGNACGILGLFLPLIPTPGVLAMRTRAFLSCEEATSVCKRQAPQGLAATLKGR